MVGAGWASLTPALAHSGGSAFARRLGGGCEELEPCLSLEAEAERRRDACVLFCDGEAAQLAAARQMRFRAEERRAVREHYRERDLSERVERERARDERREQWQREQAARAAEAAREQRYRLQLERLRQEHIDRRVADERQRRVRYYAALGREGRALRLERCLKQQERCDELVLELVEASGDDLERLTLGERNEGVVHRPKPERSPAPKAKAGEESAGAASAGVEAAEPVKAPERSDATPVPSS